MKDVSINSMAKNNMSRRNRKSNQYEDHDDLNVAFYLDELDDDELDELEDEIYESRGRRSRKSGKRKENRTHNSKQYVEPKKKKKRRFFRMRNIVAAALAILLLTQLPAIIGLFSAFEWRTFSTASNIPNTKGILILGLDDNNNSHADINSAYTDSITYVGANFKDKKAYALPIYRDAYIPVTCTGGQENINRIYMQNGIDCLAESTSAFLGLPVDYYALITMDGLIDIVNALGGVDIVPTGTFCSDYGKDDQNYCFTAGEEMRMSGPQALAYIRYRGASNGENRANRQLELIMALKNECMDNVAKCYVRAVPSLSGAVKTNIPLTEIFNIADIFSDKFDMERLDVIQGQNALTEGGWREFVDEADRAEKTNIIRNEIFHE
ncbi:LytR family transcriptional regulator [Culicoidibacter larvae]|uniref:LytR family transcriptional regulator n=2 Tax=Culicoidibacter larvae TaxID=2579976 RepID=A0A5R8QBL1_9FIRM|nr:LytR family transcriptional regulator [Culicoidibacter larvae]